MENKKQTVEETLLRRLALINSLSEKGLGIIGERARIETHPRGRVLFRRGDKDGLTTYLLEGTVELAGSGDSRERVTASTSGLLRPLAHLQPRQFTATTTTPVRLLQVERKLLDQMLALEESGGYEVVELEEAGESGDWMTMLLQSDLFQRIPTTNVQKVFQHVEKVDVAKGDVIVRQGDPGDYYYFIAEGRCAVLRDKGDGREVKLAELGTGDSFGEEALVSSAKRNASIRMESDGVLMRMTQEDFAELIKRPLLHTVTLREAQRLVANGGRWLDVRLKDEHDQDAIPDSLNVPLHKLRTAEQKLDDEITYIAYCDTGQRSASAAFLLSRHGFDIRCLQGGLDDNQEALASHVAVPAEVPSEPETLPLAAASGQIIGQRSFQEDAFRIEPLNDDRSAMLLVVADGMGGHAAGDVASRLAIDTFVSVTRRNYPTPRIAELLRHALLRANASIHDHSRRNTGTEGMGCTLVAALVEAGRCWWVSVGDSHLYLLRGRELAKLNADHSYAGHQARMKAAGKEDVPDPALAGNMLMSALNGAPIPEVDLAEKPVGLRRGDRLLLATDGLNTLAGESLVRLSATTGQNDRFVTDLLKSVEQAQEPRQDNTTLVAVEVGGGDAGGGTEPAAEQTATSSDNDQVARLNEQLRESSRQLAMALRHKAEAETAQERVEREATELRSRIERQGQSDREDLESRIQRERERRIHQLKQANAQLEEARRKRQQDEQARLEIEERFERLRVEEEQKRQQLEADAARRLREEQQRLEEKLNSLSQQIDAAESARQAAEARLSEAQQRAEAESREAAQRLSEAEQGRTRAEQLRAEAEQQAEQARRESAERDAENRQQLEARQQTELSDLERRLEEAEKLREAAEQAQRQADLEATRRLDEMSAVVEREREALEAQLREQQAEFEQRLADADRERRAAEQARIDSVAEAERLRAEQAEREALGRSELEARQQQELEAFAQRLARAEQEKQQTEQAREQAESEARRQLEAAAEKEAQERRRIESELQQQQHGLAQQLAEAERLRDEAEQERRRADEEARRQLAEVAQSEAGVRERLERELGEQQQRLEQRLAEAEQVRVAAELARQQSEQEAHAQLQAAAEREAAERERLERRLQQRQSELEQQLAEAERVRELAETARREAEAEARRQLDEAAEKEAEERARLEKALQEQAEEMNRRLAEAEQARQATERERESATEEAARRIAAATEEETRKRQAIEEELAARQSELEQQLAATTKLSEEAERAHEAALEEAHRQMQELAAHEAEQRRLLENELLSKQTGLEEQLAASARELEEARRQQQQADQERARSEAEAERLRGELTAEQARLQQEAEQRLQAERAQMEQRFTESVGQLDSMQRMHAEAEAARLAAEEEIRNLRDSQAQAEARARQEAEAQVERERKRIAAEIRESQRILEEARRQQQEAERKRAEAEEESNQIRLEHEAAGEKLRSELAARLEAERIEFNNRLNEANSRLQQADDTARRALDAEQEAIRESARIRAAEEAARMELQADVERQLRSEREKHARELAEASSRLEGAEQARREAEARQRQTETAVRELQAAMERATADNQQERLVELQAERERLRAELDQSSSALQQAEQRVQSASVDRRLAMRRADQLQQAEADASALKERAREAMDAARGEVRRLESELAEAHRKASEEADRSREEREAREIAEREYERIKGSLDNARQVAEEFREREQIDRNIRRHQRMRSLLRGLVVVALLGGLGAAGWLYRDELLGGSTPEVAPAPPPPAAEPSPVAGPSGEAAPAVLPTPAPAVTAPVPAPVTPLGPLRDRLRDGRSGPEMVSLPGAEFIMGDDAGPASERPARRVVLAPFAIGRYEVSFAEFDAFVRATDRMRPSDQTWGRGSNPVINVSWNEAVAYTRWLSSETGQRYRLPTEAEWEFAARGGTTGPYWWDLYDGIAHAHCADCDVRNLAPGRTTRVGSYPANPFGLYQTSGNVQEWVADCYRDDHRGAPSDGSARGGSCSQRVVRGGTFLSQKTQVRSTSRAQLPADARSFDTGFRVVREP